MSAAVTVDQHPANETVHPGDAGTVSQYAVTAGNNTSAAVTEILVNQFPFSVNFTPETLRVSNGTAAVNASVSVPTGFEPGEYTGEVAFLFANRSTVRRPITVSVPERRNWTVTSTSFIDTLSVGSSGVLGRVMLRNDGNIDTQIQVNTSGNISAFYDTPPRTVQTYAGMDKTAVFQYQVPADTAFGYYTGQLVFTDTANRSERVNVSARFQDEIAPEFTDEFAVAEFMATTEKEITATISDNLAVETVVANVTREIPVQQGNKTVTVNESVGSYDVAQRPQTDVWEFAFAETAEITQYYINITATDTAGNTVATADSFHVTGLDAVTVEQANFEFASDRPDATLTESVFTVSEETPLNVSLASFTTTPANSSTIVGVKQTDEASPETFDGAGDTITVAEPGTYELVVTTNEKGRFNGKLTYEPVPQHYALADTDFSGQFVDPTCPEETIYESGEYTYDFGYTDGGCLNGDVRLVITAPGTKCTGFAKPSNCINIQGVDFGRLADLADRVDRMMMKMWAAIIGAAVVVLVTTGLWVFDRRVWPYLDFELVKETD